MTLLRHLPLEVRNKIVDYTLWNSKDPLQDLRTLKKVSPDVVSVSMVAKDVSTVERLKRIIDRNSCLPDGYDDETFTFLDINAEGRIVHEVVFSFRKNNFVPNNPHIFIEDVMVLRGPDTFTVEDGFDYIMKRLKLITDMMDRPRPVVFIFEGDYSAREHFLKGNDDYIYTPIPQKNGKTLKGMVLKNASRVYYFDRIACRKYAYMEIVL
jgi:hypothetical protein